MTARGTHIFALKSIAAGAESFQNPSIPRAAADLPSGSAGGRSVPRVLPWTPIFLLFHINRIAPLYHRHHLPSVGQTYFRQEVRWCHDIGHEQAANKPLVKTVFQVMMRLFNPRKTTLLFFIRDKTKTPLENLQPILREDIQMIWDSVQKPLEHKNTPLNEFFNVEAVALSRVLKKRKNNSRSCKSKTEVFLFYYSWWACWR